MPLQHQSSYLGFNKLPKPMGPELFSNYDSEKPCIDGNRTTHQRAFPDVSASIVLGITNIYSSTLINQGFFSSSLFSKHFIQKPEPRDRVTTASKQSLYHRVLFKHQTASWQRLLVYAAKHYIHLQGLSLLSSNCPSLQHWSAR